MKKIQILFLIAMVFLPSVLLARLGETIEKCDKRYGKPVKIYKGGKVYHENGFNINVTFTNNTAFLITYSKPKKEDDLIRQRLTSKEIDKFLKVNSQKAKWKQRDPMARFFSVNDNIERLAMLRESEAQIVWDRSDGKALAFYDKNMPSENYRMLHIGLLEFINKKKEKDPLEGF
ncbi:hypothetical protein ACFLS1_07410 [Verrucomicrobiota bacterium]